MKRLIFFGTCGGAVFLFLVFYGLSIKKRMDTAAQMSCLESIAANIQKHANEIDFSRYDSHDWKPLREEEYRILMPYIKMESDCRGLKSDPLAYNTGGPIAIAIRKSGNAEMVEVRVSDTKESFVGQIRRQP